MDSGNVPIYAAGTVVFGSEVATIEGAFDAIQEWSSDGTRTILSALESDFGFEEARRFVKMLVMMRWLPSPEVSFSESDFVAVSNELHAAMLTYMLQPDCGVAGAVEAAYLASLSPEDGWKKDVWYLAKALEVSYTLHNRSTAGNDLLDMALIRLREAPLF